MQTHYGCVMPSYALECQGMDSKGVEWKKSELVTVDNAAAPMRGKTTPAACLSLGIDSRGSTTACRLVWMRDHWRLSTSLSHSLPPPPYFYMQSLSSDSLRRQRVKEAINVSSSLLSANSLIHPSTSLPLPHTLPSWLEETLCITV